MTQKPASWKSTKEEGPLCTRTLHPNPIQEVGENLSAGRPQAPGAALCSQCLARRRCPPIFPGSLLRAPPATLIVTDQSDRDNTGDSRAGSWSPPASAQPRLLHPCLFGTRLSQPATSKGAKKPGGRRRGGAPVESVAKVTPATGEAQAHAAPKALFPVRARQRTCWAPKRSWDPDQVTGLPGEQLLWVQHLEGRENAAPEPRTLASSQAGAPAGNHSIAASAQRGSLAQHTFAIIDPHFFCYWCYFYV